MEKELNLSIEGMHCAACVRRVKEALSAVGGVDVQSVEVGSAKVLFDPDRVSSQEIAAAVNHIGFDARNASGEKG